MGVLIRGNDALDINPQSGNEEFTTNGSDWLWAVTAVYGISFLAFFVTSFKARAGERIFHYIFTVSLLVGSITYYAWASGLGYSVISVVNDKHGDSWTRQVFYTKYIHWVVQFPAIITALGLLSGVSWATVIYNIVLSWIWVVSYLVSAFTASNYKWGFFAFGTAAWLLLALNTLGNGSKASSRLGVYRDHSLLAGWANFLWLLYPIAFGLTDGGNTIGVTPAAVFFGTLDVLLTPVLAFAFLVLARRWDYGKLNLEFTRYGRVHHGGNFPEKSAVAPAHAGVTNDQPAP